MLVHSPELIDLSDPSTRPFRLALTATQGACQIKQFKLVEYCHHDHFIRSTLMWSHGPSISVQSQSPDAITDFSTLSLIVRFGLVNCLQGDCQLAPESARSILRAPFSILELLLPIRWHSNAAGSRGPQMPASAFCLEKSAKPWPIRHHHRLSFLRQRRARMED